MDHSNQTQMTYTAFRRRRNAGHQFEFKTDHSRQIVPSYDKFKMSVLYSRQPINGCHSLTNASDFKDLTHGDCETI